MTGFAFVFGVAAAGDRVGRRRQEPAGARHRRDGRHDRRRVLALFFVPVFFVVVQKLLTRRGKDDADPVAPTIVPAEMADTH